MKQRTWVETGVQELFDLSAQDLVIVEFKAALALALQHARQRQKLTREGAAKRIGTSPAQVARMEAGRSSITIDRLIEALTALGVTRSTILRALNSAA
jgi:transcriptional regulator with XRE-family HTH domain